MTQAIENINKAILWQTKAATKKKKKKERKKEKSPS